MTKLLSIDSNPKIKKSDALGEYFTAILHLAPANLSGYETCPLRSNGCTKACLNTAGRGQMSSVQLARIKKTKYFFERKNEFLNQLETEIKAFIKRCEKLNLKPAIRLNGTSDILWEKTGLIDKFSNVQFYDYTAIETRFRPYWQLPKNYHLTFSMKEDNESKAIEVLKMGGNVAVVFRHSLPETYLGYRVINGVDTDLRFKDEKNVIVGLIAKGKAKKDMSGFVKESFIQEERKAS